MRPHPTRLTPPVTLFPYTPRIRSRGCAACCRSSPGCSLLSCLKLLLEYRVRRVECAGAPDLGEPAGPEEGDEDRARAAGDDRSHRPEQRGEESRLRFPHHVRSCNGEQRPYGTESCR